MCVFRRALEDYETFTANLLPDTLFDSVDFVVATFVCISIGVDTDVEVDVVRTIGVKSGIIPTIR